MNALRTCIQLVNAVNEKIGSFVSWLSTVLVLVVCYDVFTRYFIRQSSVGVQELEWHIFAVLFLLGAAYTLKHDRHVRVDVIYVRLSERQKGWINLLGTLLFLIPFSLLIIWSSKDFVINSFSIGESSPNPGGLPARYLLKACIPVGFFLVLLQAFSLLCTSLETIILGGRKGVHDD